MGDPTVIGWTITVGYFIAAFLCFKAGRAPRPSGVGGRSPKSRSAWLVLGIAMLALGINKQLDLQTPFIHFGRSVALASGWYGDRRQVQTDFVGTLALFGVIFLVALLW